jgi:ribose transport system permease protein
LVRGLPSLANEFLLPAIAGDHSRRYSNHRRRRIGLAELSVGALIVQVVRIGMTFMGVSVFAQQIVFGFILVAAVAITMDRSKLLVVK